MTESIPETMHAHCCLCALVLLCTLRRSKIQCDRLMATQRWFGKQHEILSDVRSHGEEGMLLTALVTVETLARKSS